MQGRGGWPACRQGFQVALSAFPGVRRETEAPSHPLQGPRMSQLSGCTVTPLLPSTAANTHLAAVVLQYEGRGFRGQRRP